MSNSAEAAVLSAARQKTCGTQHQPSTPAQNAARASPEQLHVPHGVRIAQNSRPRLEDAFSHALIHSSSHTAIAPGVVDEAAPAVVALGCAGPQQPQPLAFFGVYDGHGGAEVAQHAASQLHQHFQAAYRQLSAAARLGAVGPGSGSACSNSSSVTMEDLCLSGSAAAAEPWHSSSSSSGSLAALTDSDSNAGNDPGCRSQHLGQEQEQRHASNLADVLALCGASTDSDSPSAAAADLSCSSSLGGSSPTCQEVWAAISGSGSSAAATKLQLASTSSKQQHQQHQHHPSRASRVVVAALREAFLCTDADLAGTEVGEVVGTTAVTAVMSQGQLFVAHCGDSRAVLCRKGVAVPLTNDHKPGRPDEMARVSSLGGKVVYKGGSHRVMGLLAMSRALGDHFLRPYVIPEPEVLCLQRCQDDELLILATDGLWDVLSCQEATTLALRSTIRARQRGASASAACRVGASVLVRGAIERGSRDNITVAVIDLRQQREDQHHIASVASVLASQCSSDLSAWAAGPAGGGAVGAVAGAGSSRKRRSSSGNDSGGDDDDGSEPLQHHQRLPQHHSSIAAYGGICGGSSSYSNRRHTSSACEPGPAGSSSGAGGGAGGSSTAPVVLAASGNGSASGGCSSSSSSGARGAGAGVTWGWSLQGLHILPHSQDSPTTSIRALAQAAAATVAAFSAGAAGGSSSSGSRSLSGIKQQQQQRQREAVTTGGPAAASSDVSAPATPTTTITTRLSPDLLLGGMQSRQGSFTRGSSGGKPPLPQQRGGV